MLKHFCPVRTYVAVFTLHVFFYLLSGHFLRLKDLASATRARVLVLWVAWAHDDRCVRDHLWLGVDLKKRAHDDRRIRDNLRYHQFDHRSSLQCDMGSDLRALGRWHDLQANLTVDLLVYQGVYCGSVWQKSHLVRPQLQGCRWIFHIVCTRSTACGKPANNF